MADFKEIIKKLRKDAHLTQEQLAVELDLSRSAVSMYERGEREPDFETLEVIADYFNVDMNYLTGWTDDPYDYETDPDNRFDSIPTAQLDHLKKIYGDDLGAIWKARQAADEGYLISKKTPTPESKRDYAKNEHEEEMLLLARHLEPIPEEERKELVNQLKSFADLYLQKVAPQEDK